MKVNEFPEEGASMNASAPRDDFAWSHDPYLKDEPIVKDLEIRIHETAYGKIMYRELCKQVHHEDARTLAEKVLANYVARAHQTIPIGQFNF